MCPKFPRLVIFSNSCRVSCCNPLVGDEEALAPEAETIGEVKERELSAGRVGDDVVGVVEKTGRY